MHTLSLQNINASEGRRSVRCASDVGSKCVLQARCWLVVLLLLLLVLLLQLLLLLLLLLLVLLLLPP